MTAAMPANVMTSITKPSRSETMNDLNCIDVAGHAADQIAGSLLCVKPQRKMLNMAVDPPAQIVHDPLARAGSRIFLDVGERRVEDRDRRPRRSPPARESPSCWR